MARSATRCIACAGMLAVGLLLGGAGTGIAIADPDESTNAGQDSAPESGSVEVNNDESGARESQSDNDPPTSTVGNGRDDIDSKPSDDDGTTKPDPVATPKPRHSVSIPILRWPTPEELMAQGPLAYVSTVEVSSLNDLFAALSQPEPEPTPGPAFRGQEEEQPVAEATGGGVDPLAAAGAEPRVFEAPLVVAPPPIAVPAGAAPAAPVRLAASGAPSQPPAAQVATAGAQAPVIRGTVASAAEPAPAQTMTPMSGQATRLGYPRYLRNPTVGELAAIALPGAGGLLFLTFSGGVIGYRQANSVRFIRTQGAARFLR